MQNVGNGSDVSEFTLITVPARDVTGSQQTIRDSANTATLCNVGDVVKYVNICLEAAARELPMENDDASMNNGWLEWALVYTKEQVQLAVPSTNLGTETVGDICAKMFRGDCLITGCIPVGAYQPIVQDIKIKIPTNKVKLQLGSTLKLISHLRTISAADVRTDSHRYIQSTMYKCYS